MHTFYQIKWKSKYLLCVSCPVVLFFWSLLWFLLTEHCDPAADGLGRGWHQVEALAANLRLVVCRSDLQLENTGRPLLLDVFFPNCRHNLPVLICKRRFFLFLSFWQEVKKANHRPTLCVEASARRGKVFRWNGLFCQCDRVSQSFLNRWRKRFTLVQWRLARGFPPWDTHFNRSTLPALTSALSRPTITGGRGGSARKTRDKNKHNAWWSGNGAEGSRKKKNDGEKRSAVTLANSRMEWPSSGQHKRETALWWEHSWQLSGKHAYLLRQGQ